MFFWNKKEVVEVDGLPITLSLRNVTDTKRVDFWYEKVTVKRFLAYKTGDTWNGVVGYEEYKKKTDLLEAKLDLILSHLKLKYIPETETKEPAKLVENTISLGQSWGVMYGQAGATGSSYYEPPSSQTSPKKKGRPKKK